jgi:iron complex transport system substrate-binding protein
MRATLPRSRTGLVRQRASAARRCIIAAVAAAIALTGTVACGGSKPATTQSPSAAAFPVTVGTLTLQTRPEHIVSLSPTGTEMLFAIGAGSQVVAVDDNSTYPPQAPKTSISAFQPNVEAIANYQPDLVLVSNDMNKIVAALAALKIPTFLAPAAQTIDDTYHQIHDLGTLTGHTAQADALAAAMRSQMATLVAGVARRSTPLRYYYELDPTYYTLTSKTFVGSLFASAGMVNIADTASKDANPYPQLSAEAIVAANPDLVFLADVKCCGQSATTVAKRPGWSTVGAVKNGQVVALDDDIASRWGPRVVDLLRAITQAAAAAP